MELKAKKSLGQHFLKSKPALQKIIDCACISSGETVLEIGPGTGILTAELLKTGAKVVSVEKDQRCIAILREKFSKEEQAGNFRLIEKDILDLNREEAGLEEGRYSIVANIPYNITGQILEEFLELKPRPRQMVLLVQKEVAERVVARDGKESILSISVKVFGKPTIVANVPRGAFVPAPNVDSAILKAENITDRAFSEKNLEIKHFFDVLHHGFAHKRKMLKSNLKEKFGTEKVQDAWQTLGLDEKVRAEDIPPETWLQIALII
jgi:16S rRNA (adenine1518-N6/adenine1519-N6)-dimethyltransferase